MQKYQIKNSYLLTPDCQNIFCNNAVNLVQLVLLPFRVAGCAEVTRAATEGAVAALQQRQLVVVRVKYLVAGLK